MQSKDLSMLTEKQIARNPAVDPKIVKEAIRMRQELERMGLWEDKGSQVRTPNEFNPDFRLSRKNRKSLITQSW